MNLITHLLHRIDILLEEISSAINATATGPKREALTEFQIMLMDQREKLEKALTS